MSNPDAAGSIQGLHLIVSDLGAARGILLEQGVEASELFHFDQGQQVPGPDPQRADYGTFCSFADPDGTGWLVQEVRSAK